MSCVDCYNGCAQTTADACVKYTGPDIPLLGVSTGDPLSKLEEEIVNKLNEFAVGQGIDLSVIDLKCTFLKDLFGCCKDKDLVNLIQLLVDANCSLKTLIDSLNAVVFAPYTFNTSCLTGLPANPTSNDILQAALNKLCAMNTTLNTINSDYVKASQLNSLIAAYLSGSSTTIQQYTKMVPYVAYEYYGPLSNFALDGSGLPATGYDKVYMCVGQTINGFTLPDKRGRTAVGVPLMPSPPSAPPMDPIVDPTLPQNAGTNYTLKQKFGTSYVTLNVSELPAHTHGVNDPGHKHTIVGLNKGAGNGSNVVGVENGTLSKQTSTNTTNITINSAGGNQSHENRQPSIAAYYIMFIP